jgi:hypothetical protein
LRLRIGLTVLVLAGIGLLLAWPWLVGPYPAPHGVPAHGSKEAKALAEYSLRFLGYIAALLLVFLSTAIMATIVVRRAREEYRQEAMDNMRQLIEATREDYQKKDEEDDA